jgi:hypothetical protein
MAEHTTLSAALAAAQAEYPTIIKGSVNPHFRSTYADLADGMSPIRPILAKHGIAYTQTFHMQDGVLVLRTSLRFGEQEIASELPIMQPQKPQDFISLTTYYRRVGLFSICGITPANEDDDGEAANTVTTTQAPPRPQQRPPERQQAPPPRRVDNAGLSPAQAVDKALGATVTPISPTPGDGDPWKLSSIPAEDVCDTIIAAIGSMPWADSRATLKRYLASGLKLTEHENGLIGTALSKRREDERQDSLLAAG